MFDLVVFTLDIENSHLPALLHKMHIIHNIYMLCFRGFSRVCIDCGLLHKMYIMCSALEDSAEFALS